MNFLSDNGLRVKVGNVIYEVKFQLVLIIGDNLGLNKILGLVDFFNTDYFCRRCKTTLKEMQTMVCEDKTKLRTKKG